MTRSTKAYKMSDRQLANLKKVAHYNSIQSISEVWPRRAQGFGQIDKVKREGRAKHSDIHLNGFLLQLTLRSLCPYISIFQEDF